VLSRRLSRLRQWAGQRFALRLGVIPLVLPIPERLRLAFSSMLVSTPITESGTAVVSQKQDAEQKRTGPLI
jgi:hypothetical protein